MFAVIMTFIIIWIVMWIFYKVMYPKPPAHYYPQEGDVLTPRTCDFCHNELAEYRGVLESKPDGEGEWFFCNYEHQADFHAGKVYRSPHQQV